MAERAGIYAREIPFLDRSVQIGVASGRVIAVSFPRARPDDAGESHPVLDQITAYCNGEPIEVGSIEVALTMATDRRDVLAALRSVPYGETVTVEQLTGMTPDLDPSSEDDRDFVRSTLAENPLPLLVPDHRVRDGPSGAPPVVEQRFRSIEGL